MTRPPDVKEIEKNIETNDMIVFLELEQNDLAKIVDLEVAKVIQRVRAKDIEVHLDRSALVFLIDRGIRSNLRRSTDAPCCGEIPGVSIGRGVPAREHQVKQGDTVEVHAAGEQLAFKVAVAGAK
jgi:hypothetical protein